MIKSHLGRLLIRLQNCTVPKAGILGFIQRQLQVVFPTNITFSFSGTTILQYFKISMVTHGFLFNNYHLFVRMRGRSEIVTMNLVKFNNSQFSPMTARQTKRRITRSGPRISSFFVGHVFHRQVVELKKELNL
jgi:hypothetical protein